MIEEIKKLGYRNIRAEKLSCKTNKLLLNIGKIDKKADLLSYALSKLLLSGLATLSCCHPYSLVYRRERM